MLSNEVKAMIAGPEGVYTCDRCVDKQATILSRQGVPLPTFYKCEWTGLDLDSDDPYRKISHVRDPKLVFHLCPFSEPFNSIYRNCVAKVVTRLGYRISRADSIFGAAPIVQDIWQAIGSSLFVVADLTGRNPNVLYEVGLAHAIGRKVILLTQDIEDVPFDLRHRRCIVYSPSPAGIRKLAAALSKTVKVLKTTAETLDIGEFLS